MRRLLSSILTVSVASAATLGAQSYYDTSVRLAPSFYTYDIKAPFNEKVTEMAFPLYALVPILPSFSVDIGTAFAMATVENANTGSSSDMSGLTDTQVRANYTFGQDLVVLTAGVNLPTGSATVDPGELEAATRIGSDFLTFPISGFGSGMGFTGGVAVARPLGAWNLGFGASMRQSGEYEPFRDETGVATKFQPGPEYRARVGLDHPFGTGRMSFGVTYSKFGDDKANAATYNTGNRYVGQLAVSNSLASHIDYSIVAWDLYRSEGTLIDGSGPRRRSTSPPSGTGPRRAT